jgi:hypothetical protein
MESGEGALGIAGKLKKSRMLPLPDPDPGSFEATEPIRKFRVLDTQRSGRAVWPRLTWPGSLERRVAHDLGRPAISQASAGQFRKMGEQRSGALGIPAHLVRGCQARRFLVARDPAIGRAKVLNRPTAGPAPTTRPLQVSRGLSGVHLQCFVGRSQSLARLALVGSRWARAAWTVAEPGAI